MRTLERLINVLGWPAIGLGLAHCLFGRAPVPLLVCAAIGLAIGFLMPSLFCKGVGNVGTVAQPFGQMGVERRTGQERS